MSRTQLVYQSEMYLFNLTARVLAFKAAGDKGTLVLDRTVFYPQGGGQPADNGTIRSLKGDASMKVTMVKMNPDNGQVVHEGDLTGAFAVDEEVELQVDERLRSLHSRIHSAGHLMDHAIQLLGLPLKGSKGNHFPTGSFVEYSVTGELDTSPNGLQALRKKLEEKAQQMIKEKRAITVESVSPEKLDPGILETLPEKARMAEIVRLIHFENTPIPGPCGGTHVKSTEEIGNFAIKKISYKNDIFRVSYSCT